MKYRLGSCVEQPRWEFYVDLRLVKRVEVVVVGPGSVGGTRGPKTGTRS